MNMIPFPVYQVLRFYTTWHRQHAEMLGLVWLGARRPERFRCSRKTRQSRSAGPSGVLVVVLRSSSAIITPRREFKPGNSGINMENITSDNKARRSRDAGSWTGRPVLPGGQIPVGLENEAFRCHTEITGLNLIDKSRKSLIRYGSAPFTYQAA